MFVFRPRLTVSMRRNWFIFSDVIQLRIYFPCYLNDVQVLYNFIGMTQCARAFENVIYL